MDKLVLGDRQMSATTACDSSRDASRSNMGMARSRSNMELSFSRPSMAATRSNSCDRLGGHGKPSAASDGGIMPAGELDDTPTPATLEDGGSPTPVSRSAMDEERPAGGFAGSEKGGSSRMGLGSRTELSLRSITSQSTIGGKEMPLFRLLVIIGVLSLALFIAAIDQTIVATATVRISEEFDSLSLAPWLANAYL
ncbi:hypothetical protein IWQ56_006218, partial [Coemansia nantahalensis]